MEHRTDQQDPQPTPEVKSPDDDLVTTVSCPTCRVGTDARCVTRAGKPAREAHGRRYEALEQAAGITAHRAKGKRESEARGYPLYCHDNKAEAELLATYAARLAARNAPTEDADADATEPQMPTCVDCDSLTGPWRPTGDRWPSGAQKLTCTSGHASEQIPNEPSTPESRAKAAEQIAGFRIMRRREAAPGWWGIAIEIGDTRSGTVAYDFCTQQNKVSMDPNRDRRAEYYSEPMYAGSV